MNTTAKHDHHFHTMLVLSSSLLKKRFHFFIYPRSRPDHFSVHSSGHPPLSRRFQVVQHECKLIPVKEQRKL